MPEENFRYFEFGEFRLDAHRRILQKNGAPIHLTPRSFDLLRVMVENSGRILEHDELLDKVWEGTFVEQGNLKKTISALRQALGENELITTVPRKGYRFTAPVRGFSDEAIRIRETRAEIIVEEIEEDADQKSPAPARTSFFDKFKRPNIALLLVSLLVVGAICFGAWQYFKPRAQIFSAENSRSTRLISADNLRNGVVSADGNFFVYTILDKGASNLMVKQIATGGTTQVFQMNNASFWFYTLTPDGKYIYFTVYNRDDASKNGLYRIPTFGGVTELILQGLQEAGSLEM